MADNPIPEKVANFIDVAARAYGRLKEDEFSQERWVECEDIASPIEQLFYVAIHLVASANLVDLLTHEDAFTGKPGLSVIRQFRVGKYKVDFALRFWDRKTVCVELDGHDFHDRNERQRRYEKARDRHLVSAGFLVIHFTGSEVVKDPCAVALEAFNLATGLQDVAIHPLQAD